MEWEAGKWIDNSTFMAQVIQHIYVNVATACIHFDLFVTVFQGILGQVIATCTYCMLFSLGSLYLPALPVPMLSVSDALSASSSSSLSLSLSRSLSLSLTPLPAPQPCP